MSLYDWDLEWKFASVFEMVIQLDGTAQLALSAHYTTGQSIGLPELYHRLALEPNNQFLKVCFLKKNTLWNTNCTILIEVLQHDFLISCFFLVFNVLGCPPPLLNSRRTSRLLVVIIHILRSLGYCLGSSFPSSESYHEAIWKTTATPKTLHFYHEQHCVFTGQYPLIIHDGDWSRISCVHLLFKMEEDRECFKNEHYKLEK